MAKSGIVFSKDNEYYTPRRIVEYFGKFDYDPATTKEKANELCIANYDTIETDGLKTDWIKYRKIWINPPFTQKSDFISKAVETYKANKTISIYILFPIEFLTTRKFKEAIKDVKGKLYIPNGRIKFESGLGKKGKSPAFGSVVMKLQDKWEIELIDIKELQ